MMISFKRHTVIGSQLYINKSDTPQQVRRWVTQMSESGMRLIRLFMIWDQLEPSKGSWSFSVYDACFEQAEKLGMKIVPTLMCVSPPGWMYMSAGTQDIAPLDDPAYWDIAMDYVKKVVEHYRNSRALHSWILWNEPSRTVTQENLDRKDFVHFLREQYDNDITKLNRVYFCQHQDFDEFLEKGERKAVALEFSGYAEQLDWLRYQVYNLNSKLRAIAGQVRELDNLHPLHVNPHNIAFPGYAYGQSLFEEAKTVDFLGCSAHPSWHSTRFDKQRIAQSVAFFADLIKSTAAEGVPFWVSELQGGTNIFSGIDYLCPTPGDIRHWLWESFGSGAEAVVFWCFNARNSGFEGGEWGLLNQIGKPSKRLDVVWETSQIIGANQQLFDRVGAERPDIWILYSDNSIMMGSIEGQETGRNNPRNTCCGMDGVLGAYQMCSDLGYSVQMISEELLRAGKIPADAVLLAPTCYSLEEDTAKALECFVRNGGKLIADHLIGLKDQFGFLSEKNSERLAEVFGARPEDIQATAEEIPVRTDNGEVDGWFFKCELLAEGAQVLGHFEDGAVAVTGYSCGKGSAYRIGTAFFQRYFAKPEEKNKTFLQSIAGIEKEICLQNPSASLRLRILTSKEEALLILLNRQEAKTAVLKLPRNAVLQPLNGFTAVSHGERYSVPMQKDDVALYRLYRACE